jgi:RNA recognition motif-containing protein
MGTHASGRSSRYGIFFFTFIASLASRSSRDHPSAVNVHLPKDRISMAHQGFGFCEFLTEEDAEYACKIMNQIKLWGKPIRVNKVRATGLPYPLTRGLDPLKFHRPPRDHVGLFGQEATRRGRESLHRFIGRKRG